MLKRRMDTKEVLPDKRGHFGIYGGRYVPETLMAPLLELEREYKKIKRDGFFKQELNYFLKNYAGRPTPLYYASRLTEKLKGARIYLKREDLCHTGAHKINNTLGQGLLARKMGKTRIIAETGAGQHGVATATIAALLGLECDVFMGEEDMKRQALNVFRMRLLGSRVIPVTSGSKTLKDAMNEAMRDWVTNIHNTYYLVGSTAGPHPYPMIVRDFQSVIGNEVKTQMIKSERVYPDYLIACVGGGSNSMGLFYPFIDYRNIRLIGVEAAGYGIETDNHAASIVAGKPGVLHGSMSYLLQDENGQVRETHSISAGLDYPGVGPEHSYYKDTGRINYYSVMDKEALEAFKILAETEGIIPALESAHAIAYALKIAPLLKNEKRIVICVSGRGDKDVEVASKALHQLKQ